MQGFPGDGSLASMVELSEPSGFVVDAKSNVLIADSFNNRVRYLDMATGIITTLIGSGTRGLSGNGTAELVAELNNLVGLTKDALGNLVVADAENNRILRVIAMARASRQVRVHRQGLGFRADGNVR